VKIESNLAESSTEGYGSKRAVLPMMMMITPVSTTARNLVENFSQLLKYSVKVLTDLTQHSINNVMKSGQLYDHTEYRYTQENV
jgi:hypothetical protein